MEHRWSLMGAGVVLKSVSESCDGRILARIAKHTGHNASSLLPSMFQRSFERFVFFLGSQASQPQ
jgi:hypothetical protein